MAEDALPEPKTGPRILFAHHEVAIREFLDPILRKSGCDVCTVESSAEAVSQAPGFRPDILIIEPIMPHPDGVKAAKQIVQAANCRVLFLESPSTPPQSARNGCAGCDGKLPIAISSYFLTHRAFSKLYWPLRRADSEGKQKQLLIPNPGTRKTRKSLAELLSFSASRLWLDRARLLCPAPKSVRRRAGCSAKSANCCS